MPDVTNEFFENLRQKEYAYLDNQGQVYLDYTGGNLCPLTLLNQHHDLLSNQILGNPHSTNPTSQSANILIENARAKVLAFFNAHDYECVFTANASAALKIVGESYPFQKDSSFIITSDNHNSVNGIREYCKAKGGSTAYANVYYNDLKLDENHLTSLLDNAPKNVNRLFAFPAQSNVSGVKHGLKWIEIAQQKGFDVLLDAAAFVPTSQLDLSVYKPDFVSISFYKIFGYPTGIGCLLIKKTTFSKLIKPWFAGGTVTMVSVVEQNKFLASGHEKFEDGTLNYMSIPCVTFGLDYISNIGMAKINERVTTLIKYLYNQLISLKHENGKPVIKIFGHNDFTNHGGNIVLNFIDKNGDVIPFTEIELLANKKNISIRSGCFCNPGIDEINNCITNEEMAKYFSVRAEGDYFDIVHFLGKMRGAIRVSVGLATNFADLDKFVQFAAQVQNKAIKDVNILSEILA